MGIKGLNNLIKKYSPNAININDIHYYRGSTFAIDISILLYKFRYASVSDNSYIHITGLLNKIVYFLNNGILPVFIFDGIPPGDKIDTINKRFKIKDKIREKINSLSEDLKKSTEEDSKKILSEIIKFKKQLVYVTKEQKFESKEFIEILGIPCYTAEGEAEETCAKFQKRGLVNFTMTDDSDAMVFGCKNVIRIDSKSKNIIQTNLNNILSDLDINMESFVDLCIMCGCDYNTNVPKIGPITSLNLIKKYKNIENIISELPSQNWDNLNYENCRKLFNNNLKEEYPKKFELHEINTKKLKSFLEDRDFKSENIHKMSVNIEKAFANYNIFKNTNAITDRNVL